jgi:hypothetical protein
MMLVSETTNGVWRHVARGDISLSAARLAIVGLPRWFAELVDDRSLAAPALDLAGELN